MRRHLAAFTVLLAVLAGTAGCGGSGSSSATGSSSGSSTIDGLTVTGSFGKVPKIKVDGLKVSSMKSAVLIKGDGPALQDSESALLRYVIANGKNGKTLQNNYSATQPESVNVGGETDPISKAIAGEPIGTRLELALPASQVVGSQGAPQVGLGPNDPLVMVVDLVDSAPGPLSGPKGKTVKPPADAPKVVEKNGKVTGLDFGSAPKKPPTKLEVIPLINGTGPAVKEGDNLTVNYFGSVWGAKQPFDESYSAQPANFQLAQGGLIDGWVKGLQGVKVGSRVMLVIPPAQGYGKKGSPPKIPGDSTLVFVIDVLGASG